MRSRAWWDTDAHTVTCVSCHAAALGRSHETVQLALDRGRPDARGAREYRRGRPGASAAREYRRRRSSRERRAREAHPRIGRLLLALSQAPQHEVAFRSGERGELAVAAALEERAARGPSVVLHDRRMPRGHGNIDHLAITPTGVLVVDAQNVKGEVRVQTPLLGTAKLMIAGRDRTSFVDGLQRQMTAVREALASDGHAEIPVRGCLCFTNAELPLLRTRKIGGCVLSHRRAVARRLTARGPLGAEQIHALACALDRSFPPA